jgi:hypothetical protein
LPSGATFRLPRWTVKCVPRQSLGLCLMGME